ncbi:MAG: hypothetical protein ACFFDW_12095, partial [Candidatus Thorarchaeota archaeon]
AGRLLYVDPTGKTFYSENSQQGSRKHNLEQQVTSASNREKYNFFFALNRESIDLAAQGIPADWNHPVENLGGKD